MSNISRILIFLMIMILVAACDTQEEDLPTLAIVPSATASYTPTITPTPSPTETFTPSATPTNTLTFTPTLSPTNTLTFTPTLTATFTVSPTFTLTHTPTSTPTFTQTPTPTATNTPNVPIISSFTSSVNTAAPGSQVTFSWSAQADTVTLQQLQNATTVLQSFTVAQTGSQLITLQNTGGDARFRLVANRGTNQTISEIIITVTCSTTWFFNVNAPGGACPSGGATSVVGSYQPFERGIMFMYTNQQGVQRVCGLQNQNNRYLCYANGWDGSTEPFTDSAPGGLDEPDDMFNWAFDSTLASGGTWVDIIGWATTGSPNNNNVTTQYDTNNRLYIRVPNGTYFLNGDASSGTWTKIE